MRVLSKKRGCRVRTRVKSTAALGAGEWHGYGIYKQTIEDFHDGTLKDWAVYRELSKLIKKGLIEGVDFDTKPTKYRLTLLGKRSLRYEHAQIKQLEKLLRERA